MKYQFDNIVSRKNTGSVKWDKPFATEQDPLALWVADMDFPCSESIQQALHQKVEEQIYGYQLGLTIEYRTAVCQWFAKRFQWEIDPSTLYYAGGVVPAIAYLLEILCEEGDGVIIQTPVYYPFRAKIEATKRVVIENPLINQQGSYEMDMKDLEAKLARADVKGMILCSPHNPVGRVWRKEELSNVVKLAKTYGKWIISDEIHCDLIHAGIQHTPIMKVAQGYEHSIVVCTAPSKSFNLAGLQNSNIIITDPLLQQKWNDYVQERLSLHGPNCFAIAATMAAYTTADSEQWLEDVNAYVDGNEAYLQDYFAKHLPKAILSAREGTYLLWIDVRSYIADSEALEAAMLSEGLILDEGYLFGEAGKGFERINLACARSLIEEFAIRFTRAFVG